MHYPTDIGLLFDAVRKVIQQIADVCDRHGMSAWRQHVHNVKHLKRLMRIVQKKKKAHAKSEAQKERFEKAMKQAHRDLNHQSQHFLERTEKTLDKLAHSDDLKPIDLAQIALIREFRQHAKRQIDQIDRRVLQGELIPHDEKVFSLFQPHTEWISKGKSGVPVELGLRVCIMEDQHQFILHHRVMEKETDDQVAVPMVTETQKAFPHMTSCSFDKGFHSPANQQELGERLDVVAMKRKGRLSKKSREWQSSAPFKQAAHKHSAVESAINALEVHGLDKCLDHGIEGLKRYVALAVVTRNIHRMGEMLNRKEKAKQARQNRACRDGTLLLAA